MARGLGCVCCYSVCFLVLFLHLSAVDSRQNVDNHVGYLVDRQSLNIQSKIHTLPDNGVHRYRRQVNGSANQTSSPSTNSTSESFTEEITVPHTTHGLDQLSTASSNNSTSTVPTTTTNTTTSATSGTTKGTSGTTSQTASTTTKKTSSTTNSNESTTLQTTVKKDNHNYYISTIRPDSSSSYFVELENPTTQETLSSGHRVAVTVALPFKFRFYGHNITNITIATGGFIYTSPFLHQWLTATQYIAPLMANFDTSSTRDSEVLYKQVGNEFIVEWHNVLLKDQNSTGPFVFQAKLRNDGAITFVYLKLPVSVTNISTVNHPVKIGLSDAFYNDTFIPQYGIKRRTIYEYHRVSFMPEQIEEGTVVVLEPLPTCNVIEDCRTCTEHVNVNFDCKWCEKVNRCSDGLDWNRQNWIEQGCTNLALIESSRCGGLERTSTETTASRSSSTSSPNIPTAVTTNTLVSVTAGNSRVASTVSTDSRHTPDLTTVTMHIPTTAMKPASILVSMSTTAPALTYILTTAMHSSPIPVSTSSPIITAPHPDAVHTSKFFSSPSSPTSSPNSVMTIGSLTSEECGQTQSSKCEKEKSTNVAAIVVVVLTLVLLFGGLGIWLFYAYTHPTSSSGIWLMEHRPSQMKARLANMKFWKSSTPNGTKYQVEAEA